MTLVFAWVIEGSMAVYAVESGMTAPPMGVKFRLFDDVSACCEANGDE